MDLFLMLKYGLCHYFYLKQASFPFHCGGKRNILAYLITFNLNVVMSIVGVDLAGVETRPTGFCVFDNMVVATWMLYTDKEILQRINPIKPRLIAIDASLCLPRGRKRIEERTSVHLRECDRALLNMGIKLFPITL